MDKIVEEKRKGFIGEKMIKRNNQLLIKFISEMTDLKYEELLEKYENFRIEDKMVIKLEEKEIEELIDSTKKKYYMVEVKGEKMGISKNLGKFD